MGSGSRGREEGEGREGRERDDEWRRLRGLMRRGNGAFRMI